MDIKAALRLCTLLLLASCGEDAEGTESKEPLRILALGDSYTIGEGGPAEDRWPEYLAKSIGKKNSRPIEITYVARTGWTSGRLLREVGKQQLADAYDLVTLMIGVNDQYQGLTSETLLKNFRELMDLANLKAAKDKTRVVVLSIPDWSQSPFGRATAPTSTSATIDRFNTVLKQEVIKRGIAFIDVTDLTRDQGQKDSTYTKDGLHYAGSMHSQWADRVFQWYQTIPR